MRRGWQRNAAAVAHVLSGRASSLQPPTAVRKCAVAVGAARSTARVRCALQSRSSSAPAPARTLGSTRRCPQSQPQSFCSRFFGSRFGSCRFGWRVPVARWLISDDGMIVRFVRQLWGTPEAVEPDGSISKQKVPVAWLGGIVTADVPPPFPRHAHSLAATRSRQSAVDPAGTCADTNVLCTWPGDCCTRPPPLP